MFKKIAVFCLILCTSTFIRPSFDPYKGADKSTIDHKRESLIAMLAQFDDIIQKTRNESKASLLFVQYCPFTTTRMFSDQELARMLNSIEEKQNLFKSKINEALLEIDSNNNLHRDFFYRFTNEWDNLNQLIKSITKTKKSETFINPDSISAINKFNLNVQIAVPRKVVAAEVLKPLPSADKPEVWEIRLPNNPVTTDLSDSNQRSRRRIRFFRGNSKITLSVAAAAVASLFTYYVYKHVTRERKSKK